jgi:hypothetical protein
MQTESIWTVLITAITVLGSASAWRFYEKRADQKKDEDNFIKQDCRERITKLEALLLRSSEEKDEMRQTILLLTEQVAKLTVKVEYLEGDKPQPIRTTRKRRVDENI